MSWAEVHAGIYGAWRLARRDPAGMAWINDSPAGFWRSFWAAALVLPGVAALEILSGSLGADPGLRALAVKLIAYAIDWTAFPLLMVVVADSLGRFGRYWRYLAVYNWSAVVQVGLLLPAVAVAVLTQSPVAMLLVQALTVLLLAYRAYMAHVALEVGVGTAIGIAFMDALLSVLVDVVADRLVAGTLWGAGA